MYQQVEEFVSVLHQVYVTGIIFKLLKRKSKTKTRHGVAVQKLFFITTLCTDAKFLWQLDLISRSHLRQEKKRK